MKGLSIIIAISIFLIGMVAVNFVTSDVTIARSSSGLDCTNTSISDGNKLTCLAVDWVVPYFFIIIFSAAGGAITEQFLR